MRRFNRKEISTAIIALFITLMLFAIFVMVYDRVQANRVSYIVDSANSCAWAVDVIIGRTTNNDAELEIVRINKSESSDYIVDAVTNEKCTVRLGDEQGSFAQQLNEEYQNSQ